MRRTVVWPSGCLLGLLVSCEAGTPASGGARVLDPVTAPVIAVMRSAHGELRENLQTWCERITTAGQWRELRQRLNGELALLPDDWCDFEHDCVVVLAAAAAPVWPGFTVRALEEEGVDVVIVAQAGPSGEEVPERSSCLLLVVPRRPAQLAVVLRQQFGPGPGSEKTVRVFAVP